MSYALKVIKDNPVMFLPLDETSGSVAYDISGCGNDGTHSDGIVSGLLPLIPGGATGTTITNTKYVDCSLDKNYYGESQVVSFGQNGFSDNDFSMEIWIYPNFNTSENLIFGDPVNHVGIFWEKGNLIFRLQSEVLEYTVPEYNKALHIVAVYGVNRASIFLDGVIVASKVLTNFSFTNTYLNISVGPTAGSNSSFVVDAPAIYRYSLSPMQVQTHYEAAQQQVLPIHIVAPDNGHLYPLSDENTKVMSSTTYPSIYSLEQFAVDGLSYDTLTDSLYLTPTSESISKSVSFKEAISVPVQDSFVRSKILWSGHNGITVETSIDDITYESCENGQQIPQYAGGIGLSNGQLFIRVTFDSSDASRFNPELNYLNISFYTTNNIYGYNFGEYISPTTGSSYTLENKNYHILSRYYKNGLNLKSTNSFKINSIRDIGSVEMFYVRKDSSAGGLIYSGSTYYEWDSSGTISKNNISKIYINGVDKTSSTDLDLIIKPNELYHVVICLSSPIDSGSDLIFNGGPSGSSSAGLYKNIGIYEAALSQSSVSNHYAMYIGRPSVTVSDTVINVTEQTPQVNTNDWIVLKSI